MNTRERSELPLLNPLLRGAPVSAGAWAAFWDRVRDPTAESREFPAVLRALCELPQSEETLAGFIRSLRPEPVARPIESDAPVVNPVGIGGGPGTFNISTAAAIVAAACGAQVIKSGSRAYTSQLGSTDLIARAGLGHSASPEDLERRRARHGLAFAGQHAYPAELTRLARRIIPLGMREYGRFLNVVGPFLAEVPATAVVLGLSARASDRRVRAIDPLSARRPLWTCASESGVDELLSVDRCRVTDPRGVVRVIERGEIGTGVGRLEDLAPAPVENAIAHFEALLASQLGPAPTETVALNAALVLLAGERVDDLEEGFVRASAALEDGAAHALFERLRDEEHARTATVTAGRTP